MPKPLVQRHLVADLSPSLWDEVWEFASRFNEGSRQAFEASLRAKRFLVTLRERPSKRLIGIGAIDVYPFDGPRADAHGRPGRCIVIYTGNLAFEPGLRGFSLVQRIGFKCYLEARLRHPLTPVWLFYDTFSYKSYLMLANNFGTYWPRFDRETPPDVLDFIDRLGQHRYAAGWDVTRGLCRGGERRLRSGVADVTPDLLDNPFIRYFAARNPGYANGDMLAVVAPLNVSNWQAVWRRFWQRKKRNASPDLKVDR